MSKQSAEDYLDKLLKSVGEEIEEPTALAETDIAFEEQNEMEIGEA